MTGDRRVFERLKTNLLGELHLMTAADLRAYWKQCKWPKPNLIELAKSKSSPLANALKILPPEILAEASRQSDPFGWVLALWDLPEWSEYCSTHRAPWMTRIWLAAASQLRAERRLIHRSHGWGDTWEKARQNRDNPDRLRFADEFFFAQLHHANGKRRSELLATPGLEERVAQARHEKDGTFLRRLRRAKHGTGVRSGVSMAEKFLVQHWLELPRELPGLCFFSDLALHGLLEIFGLSTGGALATKQVRIRLGLIQAGAKRHLIEQVIPTGTKLSFTGSTVAQPWTASNGHILWGTRRLWPRCR